MSYLDASMRPDGLDVTPRRARWLIATLMIGVLVACRPDP